MAHRFVTGQQFAVECGIFTLRLIQLLREEGQWLVAFSRPLLQNCTYVGVRGVHRHVQLRMRLRMC
jgi:hypothetical protein